MGKVRKSGSRNRELAAGIRALGRSASYGARRLDLLKKKNGGAFPKTAKAEKKEEPVAETRWYQAEDAPKPVRSRKSHHKPASLRASITPGTVLILLAGRFRGRRVVFLKQLESGLLLVSGPFKVNGVPLRRVNQAYVIATSTKIDVSGVKVDEYGDDFFARDAAPKKAGDELFESKDGGKKEVTDKIKAAQKSVDTVLLKAVDKVPDLRKFLGARFSLTKNMRPHLMNF